MSSTTNPSVAPYINGQQNGSTKVVLVTSESMEIDHSRNGKTTSSSTNGTDEELTSLTWLHDKNLLKGNYNILFFFFFVIFNKIVCFLFDFLRYKYNVSSKC